MRVWRTLPFYGAVLFVLSAWWYAALSPSPDTPRSLPPLAAASVSLTPSLPSVFPYLSKLDRTALHRALAGDIKLMKKLINEWDVDAQILESEGIFSAKRLPRGRYVRGQLLARKLAVAAPAFSEKRYLPQTYQAASYLMALAPPEQIIAIPKGLRHQKALYSTALTAKIPLNLDACQGEYLYGTNPALAIVSNVYTDPAVIRMLQDQNIPLVAHKNAETVRDIQESIVEVGKAAGHQQKAELLSIFIEAAMLAIDNRLLAMHHATMESGESLASLYVSYHTCYSTPTTATLTGKLLERAHAATPLQNDASAFSIQLEAEDLHALNPDALIVSTENPHATWRHLAASPSLREVSAIQNGKVFFVSETVQSASDQYLVLAYYDIACGLIHANVF